MGSTDIHIHSETLVNDGHLKTKLGPKTPGSRFYGPWKILGKNAVMVIFACRRFFSISDFVIQILPGP
jgi:hypothetical protein